MRNSNHFTTYGVDPYGVPRAWASARTLAASVARLRQESIAYVQAKHALGEDTVLRLWYCKANGDRVDLLTTIDQTTKV